MVCILLVISAFDLSRSQTHQWLRFNTGNSKLPNDDVHAIAIDSVGVVWIGTDSGLTRFDGVRWRTFRTRTEGAQFNPVRAITIDGMRNIWVGTRMVLTVFLENMTGRCNFFHLFNDDQDEFGYKVGSLHADKKNNIWIGYPHGIARMSLPQVMDSIKASRGSMTNPFSERGSDHTIMRSYNLNTLSSLQHSDSRNPDIPIIEDNWGAIWISDGMSLKRISDEVLFDFDLSDIDFPPTSMASDQKGNLWCGNNIDGVIKFNRGITRPYFHMSKLDPDIWIGGIQDIKVDSGGDVWAGAKWGLLQFDGTIWYAYDLTNTEIPYTHPRYDPSNFINAIAIDPHDDIWIGTKNGIVISESNVTIANRTISEENGWVETPGLSYDDARHLASNPELPGRILVAGSPGGTDAAGSVFVSSNNGTSWTHIKNPPWRSPIASIFFSGSNFLVGAMDGVFLSTDNGVSWSSLTSAAAQTFAKSGKSILIAGPDGIFLSINNGVDWELIDSGYVVTKKIVTAVAIKDKILFAATSSDGIFRSNDMGATWISVNNGLISKQTTALAVLGTNLLAGTSHGVCLSTNNGEDWKSFDGCPYDTPISRFAVKDENLFVVTQKSVFLCGKDDLRWSTTDIGAANIEIVELAIVGSDLFATTADGGIWKRSLSTIIK